MNLPPPPPPPPRRPNNQNAAAAASSSSSKPKQRSTAFVPPPPPPPAAAAAMSYSQPSASMSSSYGGTSHNPNASGSSYSSSSSYTSSIPKSNEPYGAVGTGMTKRTTSSSIQNQTSTYSYGGSQPSAYASRMTATTTTPSSMTTIPKTAASSNHPASSKNHHNSTDPTSKAQRIQNQRLGSGLALCFGSILWFHGDTLWVLQLCLILALILYAVDLMNLRDVTLSLVWIFSVVFTMASGFATLLQVDDADATGSHMLFYLLRLTVEGLLFLSMVRTYVPMYDSILELIVRLCVIKSS